MTPDARTLAFLAAIEASPADRTIRYALSDYLRDEGHGGWADAVRETAGRRPKYFPKGRMRYCWFISHFGSRHWNLVASNYWEIPNDFCRQLKRSARRRAIEANYPTFAAAMLDLWRAWVAVNRKEVTV